MAKYQELKNEIKMEIENLERLAKEMSQVSKY